uniref:Uncharacterized protein n=1 Tax=Esox lucius TaxID=8010 RepID=A0AAY5K2S9_ESOLU
MEKLFCSSIRVIRKDWPMINQRISRAQSMKSENLMQIDAGQGHVVATDTNEIPYYLQRGFIQDEWIRIPGFVKHITVGPAGTWCVDKTDRIFKYLEGKWVGNCIVLIICRH